MQKEPINPEPEKVLEEIPKGATDMTVALFFATHINDPCGVEVGPGQREDLRKSYIIRAKTMLDKMTNEDAREFLRLKIQEYEK
ncbi:MAG: hypothetical protein UR31_C0030G0004 [Parcubacteria group bacterium GW2011_GWA2_33_14]|uniref:Uncharacterized protein n=1 Tax=Candidatus Staskawiczbacteria bacterium RIFCSPHIGHO2_02_FULL_33_16 TaxID=1802204 RepID=A0A1G2HWT7_9BACT|nr:MAG: hypothetical protein UR31_C0030G0004 [Parcubacteria group bacterium GW2011_GWA2_33_14]OGZ67014.1 MAG: hypothetical protein A3D34_01305 [Candidatus Staskawiczbacteria bacterium RIFCSPHIGHO2_02_FULL_33_16]OGZ71081.1 MAG: hypothetical protein A2980_03505 [Candidatus Staskawiczbacteria bacterium RIFCSPLOWO2_01_FULL_33_13]